jgi:hypothetical protein
MPFWLMVSAPVTAVSVEIKRADVGEETGWSGGDVTTPLPVCEKLPRCTVRSPAAMVKTLPIVVHFSIDHDESPFLLNRSGGQILSVSVVFWQTGAPVAVEKSKPSTRNHQGY